MNNYFDQYDVKFYKLYVLELQNGKYYVGITKNVQSRFEEHCNGTGADYTRVYKPIRIVDIVNTQLANKVEAEDIENLHTIKWMILKGIDNVRGGEFCSLSTLSIAERLGKETKHTIDLISKAVQRTSADKCNLDTIAKMVYQRCPRYAWKKQEIEQAVTERRNKKGKAFCSVTMCVYNEHKSCRWGITPYDKYLCEEHYMVRAL